MKHGTRPEDVPIPYRQRRRRFLIAQSKRYHEFPRLHRRTIDGLSISTMTYQCALHCDLLRG